MRTMRANELLALPVRLHGIQLGLAADLLLDREELKAMGLDVLCGDEIHRFLPLPTMTYDAEQISIPSPLVLLEEDELAFYRARGFVLSALRGQAVEQRGRELGKLVDVVIGSDGALVELVVDAGGVERRIRHDNAVRLTPGSRSAA